MRWVRTFGAAALAGLAVLAAPGADPAAAQPPVVVVSAPAEGSSIGAPSAASGSATMANAGTVERATVALASADGHTAEGVTYNYDRTAGSNPPVFSSSSIDSVKFSFNVAPRYNGAYTVTASAVGRDPTPDINGEETSSNTVRRFNVEFAPLAPSGVSASIDENKRATVTWAANAEPDLVGYQLQRAYGTGSYKEIGLSGVAANPSFSDDLSGIPPGQYRYRVVAIRRARTCSNPTTDPACNRGITSGASAYDDVTVRSTPATTTTTIGSRSTSTTRGSGSGGSSGGTGGSNSGNPTFVPGGRVDLSDFSALLNGRGTITRIPDRIDDGSFESELKYNERLAAEEAEQDPGTIEIGGRTIGPLKTSDDWVKFLGAGSLATALLVHVLWFKGQVDSFPLEAVAPQGD